jgi:hypothetical protein
MAHIQEFSGANPLIDEWVLLARVGGPNHLSVTAHQPAPVENGKVVALQRR